MHKKLTKIAAMLAILLLVGCVAPYRKTIVYDNNILTVEGFIADDRPVRVTIQNTRKGKSLISTPLCLPK